MLDVLRKTYLAGLGLATITRDKLEETVDDLIAKGEIAEKDRKKVVEDLLTRAKEEKERFSQAVKDSVRNVVGEMKFPSRQQFEDLVSRVENLERQTQPEGKVSGEDDAAPEDA